jgi:hypothetical protein
MYGYRSTIERDMVKVYDSLSEKDRRRYAVIGRFKRGHRGAK